MKINKIMATLVRLSKDDFNSILNNYDIGRYISHNIIPWSLGNTTYFLNTSKGKFVLKFHESLYDNNLKYFKYSLKVMDFAKNKGLPVPETIKTKSGLLFIIRNKKTITIQRFVEGKGRGGKSHTDKEVRSAAKIMGRLDKTLLKIPLNGMHVHDEFKLVIWGSKKIPNFNLPAERGSLRKGLANVDKKKLKRSVIHSDLAGNFLFKDGKVSAIIDWDVVREDYIIYEPAVFIAQNLITPNNVMKNKIIIFLKEYQRYIKLNNEEKTTLYYFIKYRHLNAISYLVEHLKTRPSRKNAKYVDKTIGIYRRFNKLSLEEFLSWIN